MKILVVSSHIPFPPAGAGLWRTHHLLRALSTRHELTFVGFTYGTELEAAPFPVRIVAVPWEWPKRYQAMRGDDPAAAARARAELSADEAEPWFVSLCDSACMGQALEDVLRGEPFELVLFEGSDMARFLPLFDPATPKILDLMEVQSLRAQAEKKGKRGEELAKAAREADRTVRFERQAAAQCRICLASSESEAAAAEELLGVRHVEAIPYGIDTTWFTPSDEEPVPGSLLFTGRMSDGPNVEGARFFARDVLPLVQRRFPQARFHVVGPDPAPQVLALAGPGVVIHDKVQDARPYFAAASVVVVPVLYGNRTRLKVLEAAACGKAIVTTALGVEGLEFRDGFDLMVAYSPRQFADCVAHLLEAAAERRHLGARARRVACRYDWEDMGNRLLRVVNAVGRRKSG